MDSLREALNRGLFLGLEDFECHFALYPPGAFYRKHVDRFRDDDRRMVSAVIYLNDAMQQLVALKGNSKDTITREDIKEYVIAGATKRLRPKIMTVCVSLFALIPILWSNGVGSDVMKPIVLPMIGGVLTSATHILLVTPLIFLMTKEYELRRFGKIDVLEVKH